jgi:hypothetical protein
MKFAKSIRTGTGAVVLAGLLIGLSADRLGATAIFINSTGAGQLTYITAPGGAASQDSFFANVIDVTYGAGTLAVSGDVTNYTTGAASSGPGTAIFSFAGGTFIGSSTSLINFATGAETVTYTISGGTGVFAGYSGTVTESAQFTSFGSFSPNVPANIGIIGASGTLAAVTPEPSTALTGLLVVWVAILARYKRSCGAPIDPQRDRQRMWPGGIPGHDGNGLRG